MVRLACKTRGNTSPQGKSRVFFCCHPADFAACFPPIAEELLALQNCALFYPEDGAVLGEEEWFADLGQMQLFVMPVTTRLLTTDNPALARLFPFALEHHIPVLPLMQEEGLDGLFNEKCGDLQYLDKNGEDATAIPYSEKLKKYLDSVLVGDELAAKVRAAFDAYVFLSYRKKDRRYAQELMRLIHANDFCRDIAIWYDEFLTPGENFNEAIKAALEKSGLFVLAVTPNLVNEPNYIQQIEYPLAVEQEKPVLPAEMVPTDPAELADQYPAIPPCADAHDASALSAALLAAVERMAKRENDGSPEHRFFIGLAYLSGIDVEVDHTRALSLITGAAEAGLVEAMEKLVAMYREGMGVRRDYEAALMWKRRLVEREEAAYAASPDADTAWNLLYELDDLENYLEELHRFAEAKDVCLRMLAVCEEVPEGTERYLSTSRTDLGDVYEELGNLPAALEQHLAALALDERNLSEKDTPKNRRRVAASRERVGDTYLAMKRLAEAQAMFEKALTLRQRLAEEETPEAWSQLAAVYQDLGAVCWEQGNAAGALARCREALTIQQRATDAEASPAMRRSLMTCYSSLQEYYLCIGQLPEAMEAAQKAYELAVDVEKQTERFMDQRNVATCMDGLILCYRGQGRLAEAEEWVQKGLTLRETIAAKTDTVDARRGLAVSYTNGALLAKEMGRMKEALRQEGRAVELLRELAEQTDMPEDWQLLATVYVNRGNTYATLRYEEEALEQYRQARRIWETCLETTDTLTVRDSLAQACRLMGELHLILGDPVSARTECQRAIALQQKLVEETDKPEALYSLFASYYNLAEVEEVVSDLPAALHNLSLAEEMLTRMARQADGADVQRGLGCVYEKYGVLYGAMGDWPAARDMAELSLALFERLAEEKEAVSHRKSVARVQIQLGKIYLELEEPTKANEHFNAGLEIDRKLAAELKEISLWVNLYDDIERTVSAGYYTHYYRAALATCEQGLALLRSLDEISPDNLLIRKKLAGCYSWMGHIRNALGDRAEAREQYAASCTVYEELVEEMDTDAVWDAYANALYNQGVVTDKPEKLELWQHALEIWTALAERNPQVESHSRNCAMCREALENYA